MVEARFLVSQKSHCFPSLLHEASEYYRTNHLSIGAKDCHLKILPRGPINPKRHQIMFLADCWISQLELIAAFERICSLAE